MRRWVTRTAATVLVVGGVVGVVTVLLSPRVAAQIVNIVTGAVAGRTRSWAVPAYLKSCNLSATTTSTSCHDGPTVLGCVVINSAGAASSTIKLYNQRTGNVIAATLMETIDATQVGRQFCYGKLMTGGLVVAVASSGTAPDVTITYQGAVDPQGH